VERFSVKKKELPQNRGSETVRGVSKRGRGENLSKGGLLVVDKDCDGKKTDVRGEKKLKLAKKEDRRQ